MENQSYNKAYISGKVSKAPVFSHEICGEKFYEMTVEVPRLSGAVDRVPVTIPEKLLGQTLMLEGSEVYLSGQFRSRNELSGGKSHLMLSLFVLSVYDKPQMDSPNSVQISGYICKPPVYRITPNNREIADMMIAVNRGYNKSDYIPCITWGRNARFAEEALCLGSAVTVVGRIQSRDYTKKLGDGTAETRTAYEVSVSQIYLDKE